MDHYLDDATWNALVNRLTGPHDPDAQGWTRRDEVMQALGDAGIWPASIREGRHDPDHHLDLDKLASGAPATTGDLGQLARALAGSVPADPR